MKKFFRNIHLYLGLAAGLVIMISCITGAILVFEDELSHAFNHSRYYVKASGNALPLDELISKVKENVPKAKVVSAKVYSDKLRTVEIGVALPEKEHDKGKGKRDEGKGKGAGMSEKEGLKGKGEGKEGKKQGGPGGPRATHIIFINPYTGAVAEVYSYKETFFYQVFALHRWLLGSPQGVGKTITGISVCIFFFILITGIVLWWPKSANILKQRLKVKWDGSFKRLNHDLHVVLGFYTSVFLLAMVLSAMSLAHNWFNDGIFAITNSSKEQPEPPVSVYEAGKKSASFNDIFISAKAKVKNAEYYQIRKPKDSIGVFSISVLPKGAMEMLVDTYYADQYTASINGEFLFDQKNTGQQIRSSMKSIHMGTFLGIPSKIVWFIIAILGFTFPVTGVIMWLKRLNKKKKKAKKELLTLQNS